MATKTTTKKTTTKKTSSSEKKADVTKKVASKAASEKTTVTRKSSAKKVENTKPMKSESTSSSVETKPTRRIETSKKDGQTTSSMPVRHERQFGGYNKFYARRKKFCKLCAKGIEHVDYKDIELLSKYLNHNMKISSRKQTSACASHQRRISNAIKRARIVALIHCVKD